MKLNLVPHVRGTSSAARRVLSSPDMASIEKIAAVQREKSIRISGEGETQVSVPILSLSFCDLLDLITLQSLFRRCVAQQKKEILLVRWRSCFFFFFLTYFCFRGRGLRF